MPSKPRHTRSAPQKSTLHRTLGRANSLGMEEKQLHALLDELDAGSPAEAPAQRRFVRRSFRRLTIPLRIKRADGSVATIPVACRNVSRSGISVLHSAFLHAGTRCTMALPRADGKAMLVHGIAVRCGHRRGVIHEIGIQFDEPVDTRLLVPMGLFADWFSLETVDPSGLSGTVLAISGAEADRGVIRQCLRETELSVTGVESARAGIDKALEGYDLIICDYRLPDSDGGAVVGEIRARGVQTPVIMTTEETEGAGEEAVARKYAGIIAQAFLLKPLDEGLLLRAIAEFLQVEHRETSVHAICCTLPAGHANEPLVARYVEDLHATGDRLKAALAEKDAKACRSLCAGLTGAAGAMGFRAIGVFAERAIPLLEQEGGLEEAGVQLRSLIEACERAHARRAA